MTSSNSKEKKKKCRPSDKAKPKTKSRKLESDSSSENEDDVSYMESDASPYNETFSDLDSEPDLFNVKPNRPINPLLENYYAVFYDLNWYVGRVLDFPDEGLVKVKFLRQGLGDSYEWPLHDDIEVIDSKYVFYGPIKLIGSGPFLIDEKCKRRINLKYKSLKK